MPALPAVHLSRMPLNRIFSVSQQFGPVKSQWQNPHDILSILTIIGGDIVQRAVAQLSGHPSHFTPVAFSFGWVAYALSAVLAVMGEGKLMPPPDCDSVLVNARSQYARTNRSWILGRLIRDHETNPTKAGLTLTFYKTCTKKQGTPKLDWVFFLGVVTIVVQLGIAVIPGAVFQDWNILVVTVGGTLLSLAGGALPKWRKEKWSCRISQKKDDRTVICLTRGNGYSDVMVIISEGEGYYRLEDLANARGNPVPHTLALTLVLCVLQIVLLLIVAGLENHAWFLLAIGSLGIMQNATAAGVRRDLSTSGIHLEKVDKPINHKKVIDALKEAEERERYVGIALLPVFFPGELRKDEVKWRDDKLAQYSREKEERMQAEKEKTRTGEGQGSSRTSTTPANGSLATNARLQSRSGSTLIGLGSS